MSRWEDELIDPFLADVPEGDVSALVDGLASLEAPPPSLRDRLLAAADVDGRFDRFSASVAELLDVDPDRAKQLLDGIGRTESWYVGLVPDVHLYDIDGGPAVEDAITGFIRMPAGVPFPEHGHLGTETAIILQGSAIDDRGGIWRVGDVVVISAAEVHSFVARPGPDLVFLVVAQQGIRIGEMVLGPDDPRV